MKNPFKKMTIKYTCWRCGDSRDINKTNFQHWRFKTFTWCELCPSCFRYLGKLNGYK